MQIPSQEFETPIVIGEPAVSRRITDHQHPPICLGIFAESQQQPPSTDANDRSATTNGCSSSSTPTDAMAT
ncbi:hypothetical protein [Schlesneria paludicola]|uniref:hypothetical protein n=1 Tax=Schlesneria paludicola TaxID=360056 RepID=UPI00029AC8C1|nr:hypothetical protein [Schlesneria paludicola]